MEKRKIRWVGISVHILISVILMAIIAGILYMAVFPAVFERNLDLGYKYLYNSEYEKAATVFEKLLKIDSEKSKVIIPLAASYIGEGRHEDAVRVLDMVKELDAYEKKNVADSITVISHTKPFLASSIRDICNSGELSQQSSNSINKLMGESDKYTIISLAEKRIAQGDAYGASHIIRHIKYPHEEWITSKVIEIIRKIEKKEFQSAEDAYNIIEENNKNGSDSLPNEFLNLREELGFDNNDGRNTESFTEAVSDALTGENNIFEKITEDNPTDTDYYTPGLAFEDVSEVTDVEAENLLEGTWTGRFMSPTEYLYSTLDVPELEGFDSFIDLADNYVFEVEFEFRNNDCTFRVTNLKEVLKQMLEDCGVPGFATELAVDYIELDNMDGLLFESGYYNVEDGYIDIAGMIYRYGFTNDFKSLILEPSEQIIDESFDELGLYESDRAVYTELLTKMFTMKIKKK